MDKKLSAVMLDITSSPVESGVVYANIDPEVLDQLDRIEAMLTELTSLPHNKRDSLFQGPHPSVQEERQRVQGAHDDEAMLKMFGKIQND